MTTHSSPRKAFSSLKSDTSATMKINSINVRPSAEDFIDLERELHRLILRKNQADIHLATLETRLYDLESEYFMETQIFGNLLCGIEGYLGLPVQTNNSLVRKTPFSASNLNLNLVNNSSLQLPYNTVDTQNRMFSSTSSTYPESLAMSGRLQEALTNGYEPNTPITVSPNHPKKNSLIKKNTSMNNANINNKKNLIESTEWQPPSMKSRKR